MVPLKSGRGPITHNWRKLQRVGNYDEAMEVALGPSDDAFSEFDSQHGLDRLPMPAAASVPTSWTRWSASRLVSTAVLTLSWLAVIAVALGIRPRLQEYL